MKRTCKNCARYEPSKSYGCPYVSKCVARDISIEASTPTYWSPKTKEIALAANDLLTPFMIHDIDYSMMYKPKTPKQKALERIKNVIFNDPVTVVIWNDGTKTIVRCGEGETYDPEKGLAMAISKYFFDNKGYFNEVFKKWLPNNETEED